MGDIGIEDVQIYFITHSTTGDIMYIASDHYVSDDFDSGRTRTFSIRTDIVAEELTSVEIFEIKVRHYGYFTNLAVLNYSKTFPPIIIPENFSGMW